VPRSLRFFRKGRVLALRWLSQVHLPDVTMVTRPLPKSGKERGTRQEIGPCTSGGRGRSGGEQGGSGQSGDSPRSRKARDLGRPWGNSVRQGNSPTQANKRLEWATRRMWAPVR